MLAARDRVASLPKRKAKRLPPYTIILDMVDTDVLERRRGVEVKGGGPGSGQSQQARSARALYASLGFDALKSHGRFDGLMEKKSKVRGKLRRECLVVMSLSVESGSTAAQLRVGKGSRAISSLFTSLAVARGRPEGNCWGHNARSRVTSTSLSFQSLTSWQDTFACRCECCLRIAGLSA